ncbi:MAG TPA: DUF5666 domain-containing protein [Verrucomicrobiae bacterium]|nr:DUF5666 domain-containing protein [Verrucomicrobiae bacterium]
MRRGFATIRSEFQERLVHSLHSRTKKSCLSLATVTMALAGALSFPAGAAPHAPMPPQSAAHTSVAREVGVIKSISGNNIILATDSGAEIAVQLLDNARKVRVEPGQKDLKSAAPIELSDLHPGDRILVWGEPSSDRKSFTASGLIAMVRSDLEAKHAQEREEWRKNGIGGLVTSVDPAAGTVTISVTTFAGIKTVTIHTTKSTILRRYSPESVRFDDAKPAPLGQIEPGDQLRARGTLSADGSEFTADEIVSGTFRNIAGTIAAIDPQAKTITVQDLIEKKSVVVRITDESQLRKLPPEFAQRIAFRMKQAMTGANQPESSAPAEGGARRPSGGHADFQQILNRIPPSTIADLQKGDAVMIVTTAGDSSGEVTAITLVDGVEPILAAAPNNRQAMTLSPWSLGGAPAGEGDDASQ